MVNMDFLKQCKNDSQTLTATAAALEPEDIAALVELLGEKDNNIRYGALLMLQRRSDDTPDVRPFWEVFAKKLESENSYQRSIGVMLLAQNVRWAGEQTFRPVLGKYLNCCQDEKFITSRQTIQSVRQWAVYAPKLLPETAEYLMRIDVFGIATNHRKLILTDILDTLFAIWQIQPLPDIPSYIKHVLESGLIDIKTRKRYEVVLQA